jgi:two-component system sensor histidine kinase YesM
MKKILQLLHRKIDGKSIRLIFTALFFLTVSLFTALKIPRKDALVMLELMPTP